MKRETPTGILGFPVAPLNKQGELDVPALERNIQFLLEGGLSCIYVGCGAGEFHALSHNEYKRMVEAAVSIVKGKVPVYTGVGGNISHAIELAKLSEKLGADGYLMLPPYLIDGEQEGLYQYLNAIIGSTDLNAIIYQRDNCVLHLNTIQRLLHYPQLVGLKDGLGNMELNIEVTQTIGSRLAYMSGMPMAEVTFAAFANIGFQSYSSAISNYIPHISRLFFDALKKGDEVLLHELYIHVLFPINRIRKQRKGYAVSLIKAGMEIIGLPVGTEVRAPIIQVEKEHYKELEQILKATFDRFPKPEVSHE
jgi:5-dehydro-4-deoxyglucarate dehydratase